MMEKEKTEEKTNKKAESQQPKNATKHYKYYPEGDFPQYLAYGFRPIFLLLAPYMILSIALWGFVFSGALPIFADPLSWHIYELLYGVGIAGIMAFLFTGLPELFPGVAPIVGRHLFWIVALWVAGRISFWLVDFVSVWVAGALNVGLAIYALGWAFRPVVLDPLQRHSSIAYAIVSLTIIQVWFFASFAGYAATPPLEILKIATGGFVVLILLAMRRVNMEAINEAMEDRNIDDKFIAYPFRYNLAIFTVILFTGVEFLYPANPILAWLGFGAGAAILGILNDYNLRIESIMKMPYTYYLGAVFVLAGIGYALLGYSYLTQTGGQNHFRHFLTTGMFGLSFYMVMIIVSYVHTGRHLGSNIWINASVLMIIASAFIRGLVPFYEDRYTLALAISTVLWILPFAIYYATFYKWLLQPRADGVKG